MGSKEARYFPEPVGLGGLRCRNRPACSVQTWARPCGVRRSCPGRWDPRLQAVTRRPGCVTCTGFHPRLTGPGGQQHCSQLEGGPGRAVSTPGTSRLLLLGEQRHTHPPGRQKRARLGVREKGANGLSLSSERPPPGPIRGLLTINPYAPPPRAIAARVPFRLHRQDQFLRENISGERK